MYAALLQAQTHITAVEVSSLIAFIIAQQSSSYPNSLVLNANKTRTKP